MLSEPDTGITLVIFYVPLEPCGNLMLVERIDGRFYIVKNDELLIDRSWTSEEAPQVLAMFNSMKLSAKIKKFPKVRSAIAPMQPDSAHRNAGGRSQKSDVVGLGRRSGPRAASQND